MNPILWVNRAQLIKNFNFIKKKTSSDFICPMVKANAYGVGDTLVVGTLLEAGAKHFGVARFFEGEKLRRFFPKQKFNILVFNALTENSIRSCVESELTPVIGKEKDLKILESCSKGDLKKLKKVHLKFDLGMSRFGFALNDVEVVAGKIRSLGLDVEGVCGHFPEAEDFFEPEGLSEGILKDLVKAAGKIGILEEHVHGPNTSAIERGSFKVGLRPGLALYGLSQYKEPGLDGVLRLTAPLVAINDLSKGARVSYGGEWRAEEDVRVGIVPVGYADGLRRGLSGRIRCKINGKFYFQVGAICMDYCMINLGNAGSFKEGDEVTLFDENGSSLLEWSEIIKTIPYEILTGLGERIERRGF